MKLTYQAMGEALTFARFFLVGIVATLIHMIVAAILIASFSVPVFLSNLIAFLVAFLFAFSGHYIWTFRKKANLYRSLIRYFTISGTAFATNNLVLLGLVKSGRLSDMVSVILAALIIPLISYTASRLWGFKP